MNLDAERSERLFNEAHQDLLRLVRDVVAAAAADAIPKDSIAEALLNLTASLADHVAAEQEAMHASHYPAIEPHVAAHDQLLRALSDILPAHRTGSRNGVLQRAQAFEQAMQQHIATWDWNLVDYLRKSSQPRTPEGPTEDR